MVDVARSVIVILFMGEFSSDYESLLTCIRNNCCAIALKDWREIRDKRLKFHLIFEWFAANEGIHVGSEHLARPSVDGGLWTWNSL
jgi:hypothetical protein